MPATAALAIAVDERLPAFLKATHCLQGEQLLLACVQALEALPGVVQALAVLRHADALQVLAGRMEAGTLLDVAGTPLAGEPDASWQFWPQAHADFAMASWLGDGQALLAWPLHAASGGCCGHLLLELQERDEPPAALLDWLALSGQRLSIDLQCRQRALDAESLSRRLDFQNRILAMLARNRPQQEVLDCLLGAIEREHPRMRCSLMLPDAAGKRLLLASAPSLPAEYCQMASGVRIGEGMGSCGTAAWRGERVVVDDLQSHPFWRGFHTITARCGLRSCWSQPVLDAGGQLLGVFAIYHGYSCQPSADDLQLIESVADLTGVVLEHYAARQALERKTSQLQMFLRNSQDGVVILDPEGRFVEVSEGFVRQVRADSIDSVLQSRLWDWDAGHDEAAVRRFIRHCLRGPRSFETLCRRSDGSTWHAEIRAAAFDNDGQTLIWAAARDISERQGMLDALARERGQMQTLIGIIPDLVWLKDPDGRFLHCNRRFEQLYGATERQIAGHTDYEFVDRELADLFRFHDRRAMEAGSPTVNEEWLTFADGHRELVETTKVPVHDEQGHLIGVLGIAHDITARRESELALRRIAEEQRALIAALPDIVMRFDQDARLLFVSENVQQVTGLPASDYLGHTPREVGLPLMLGDFLERTVRKVLRTAVVFETEFMLPGESGMRVFNWRLLPEQDERGHVHSIMSVARDITQLKKYQERLEYLAHHDALTGLPNRVLLTERLLRAMQRTVMRQRVLALVYLDLDGFKAVNDRYGHARGDQLLIRVAARMRDALRSGDTLARLGGDEFVAVLTDLPGRVACQPILERLLAAAAQEVECCADTSLRVSASLGVVFYPQGGAAGDEQLDAEQLLRQADQAMYQAKLQGRNRYVIFDGNPQTLQQKH